MKRPAQSLDALLTASRLRYTLLHSAEKDAFKLDDYSSRTDIQQAYEQKYISDPAVNIDCTLDNPVRLS